MVSSLPLFTSHRVCVAPMLDWTDRHYRFMARQISHHVRLYTEMVHAGAVVFGDTARFLAYNECEHPLALQLGGSDPALLAKATAAAHQAGYDEVNLNCGCPSPRVQKGSFGAMLMQDVALVVDCLNAMQDAAEVLVSIKHRIGVDRCQSYDLLADFVGTLGTKTTCTTFIVHARNAWLKGLSPKENREIPLLNYDFVYRLKREFPQLNIVINGGIKTNDEIAEHLQHVDGVMIGREAYHNPLIMQDWDARFFADETAKPFNFQTFIGYLHTYAAAQIAQNNGVQLRHMARHYLGVSHGKNGAKRWRQMLSDAKLLSRNEAGLILEVLAALNEAAD